MRRVACLAASSVAVAGRAVHSVAVQQNVVAETTVQPLGVPVNRDAIAAAHRVPTAILDTIENPRLVAFTQMDLVRARHAVLIASVTDKTGDLRHIELEVEKRFIKDPSKRKSVPGALKQFSSNQWKDMVSLITFYEETMYPIRVAQREYAGHELTSFHVKDVLKRGLSAFKQDYLDEQKKELAKVQVEMKRCTDFISAAVKDAFTTEVCNDIANMLRVAGERYEHAHGMSMKVLNDMTMMRIPFDASTREIVQATIFNDGPFDNSPLLFQVIEYPERGEVSLGNATLEETSSEILKLISNRHQTPLDDGVLLRSEETHPNLQRSPE